MIDYQHLPSAHAVEHLVRNLRTIVDFPKPGIRFKDITPLLADPQCLHLILDLLAQPFIGQDIGAIVAMEARGFIFGGALAARLNASFVPVRKPGKLPSKTRKESYELEYGTDALEVHEDAAEHGHRVLIVDDLLATGGTAAATVRLVRASGAEVVGLQFLIELTSLAGREKLQGEAVESVLSY
jgi:adenine phosphoribosyltransferase